MGSAGTTVATDELIVATLDKQKSSVFDQYFEKIPLFEWLKRNENVDWDGGGVTLRYPIRIGKNTSSGKTSGYKTVITNPVSTIREVLYRLRNYYATITYSQDMKDINRGNYAAVKLISDKMEEAKDSIIDNISTDLYATSTETDAIDSLLVGVDSTGAIGGLNQSTHSQWAAYEASMGSFGAGGVEAMQLAYNTVSKGRGSGSPGLVVTDQTTFQYYQNAVRAFGGDWFASRGDLGVDELKFMGAKVIWDADCAAGTMLMLNSRAVSLAIDGQANMKATEFSKPPNQFAYIGQIYSRIQVIIRERRALAKLTGITA